MYDDPGQHPLGSIPELTMISLRRSVGQDAAQSGVGPHATLLSHDREPAELSVSRLLRKAVCQLGKERKAGRWLDATECCNHLTTISDFITKAGVEVRRIKN